MSKVSISIDTWMEAIPNDNKIVIEWTHQQLTQISIYVNEMIYK